MNTKRVIAFFIDFIITSFVFEIPFFIFVIKPITAGVNVTELNFVLRSLISCVVGILYLVLRDIPESGSFGKKIMKLKLVDIYSKDKVSVGKRILRNITWILGGVEVIVFLFAKKRLGDIIAKTDIVNRE